MNIIVTGSREVFDREVHAAAYAMFKEEIEYVRQFEAIHIIHGDCPNSPDMWAKDYEGFHNVHITAMPAEWNTFGKAAGSMRNRAMASYTKLTGDKTICIAVWDGKSFGTLNMIKEAVKRGFPVTVIPATM